jgi:hypothetical protein
MLRRQSNRTEAVICLEGTTTASLPAAGTVITSSNLPNGSICIVDEGNRRLDNTAFDALGANDKWRIVQSLGASKPLYKSNFFKGDDTNGNWTARVRAFREAQNQVSCIGYNGATGSLPSANDTSYFVKIRKNDNDAANRSQPTDIFFQFTSDASATQQEVAFGLFANAIKNLKREPANGYLRCEVIGDQTSAAGSHGALMFFTKGSKTVTYHTGALAASTGTVADGAVITAPSSGGRVFTFTAQDAVTHTITIGETTYTIADQNTAADGSDNAAAIVTALNAGTQVYASVTDTDDVDIRLRPGLEFLPPVVWNGSASISVTFDDQADTGYGGDNRPVMYTVDGAVTGAASFTMDQEWQGETGYAVVGTDVDVNAGTATVTNFGIKLTGKRPSFDVAAFRDAYAVRFTPTFSDTTTLVTLTQGGTEGSNMWERVAMDEYFAQWGNEGMDMMTDTPPRAREAVVPANSRWSALVVSASDTTGGFLTNASTPASVIIYGELDEAAPLGTLTNANSTFEAMRTVLNGGGADTDFDEVWNYADIQI